MPLKPEQLLSRLLEIGDFPTFEQFLSEHPELVGEAMLQQIDEMHADPIIGTAMAAQADLLHASADNPRRAWEKYEETISAAATVGEELDLKRKEVDAALAEPRAEDVLSIADAAIPRAEEAGLMLMVSLFQESRGKALMQLKSGDRAANLDAAISSFEEAGRRAPDEGHRAVIHMDLGVAYRERVRGDRAQNLERAIFFLRDSLSLLHDSAPPEIWAIVRTNLASTLLLVDRGDRAADLREAAKLCREALEFRSPERDATDWGYTQLNLADILQELALLGEGELDEAEAAYREVIERGELVPRWMLGNAHTDLGRLLRISTDHDEAERAAMAETPELRQQVETEDQPVLEAAREHFEIGLPLTEDDWFPIRRGRALSEYVSVLARLDLADESIASGEEAMTILRPTSAPKECLSTARALGSQLTDRGEWEHAAPVWRDAFEAANLMFHGHLDTEARERQIDEAGEVSRWAAYVLAKVGEDVEAAVVLEASRTLEIRRRIGPSEAEVARLDQLPEELREAFHAATAALAASPFDDAAAEAGRRLQEIVTQIREFPEMEDFAATPDVERLVGAVEPNWPLLYVNPTPWGTLLLKLSSGAESVEVESLQLDSPTSLEVLGQLAGGDSGWGPAVDAGASYLLGAAAIGTADLKAGLEQALPLIAEGISRPIAEWLEPSGAGGVTLVACGPIGAAPLHAASWDSGQGQRCLLDSLTVRYAPSALLTSIACERAAERDGREPTLLALADPNQNLRAAGPEVAVIAGNFGGRSVIGSGSEATADFLRANLTGATHVHFSCHGAGGHFDKAEAGVLLADGFLPAADLAAVTDLDARLAVISACQAAVPQIIGAPNEVYATSTVLWPQAAHARLHHSGLSGIYQLRF